MVGPLASIPPAIAAGVVRIGVPAGRRGAISHAHLPSGPSGEPRLARWCTPPVKKRSEKRRERSEPNRCTFGHGVVAGAELALHEPALDTSVSRLASRIRTLWAATALDGDTATASFAASTSSPHACATCEIRTPRAVRPRGGTRTAIASSRGGTCAQFANTWELWRYECR